MDLLKRLTRRLPAFIALLILVGLVLLAVAAPVLIPLEGSQQDLSRRLKPPGWEDEQGNVFLAGTDQLGRDLAPRLIHGSRVSLIVAGATVALGGGLGLALGTFSGYMGGKIDLVIQHFTDIQLAFPFLLLALTFVSILGPGLLNIIVVLSLTSWISYAKVIRGVSLRLRNYEFVEASRSLGGSDIHIMRRHLLPNVLAPFLVIASFQAAAMVIAEASLSFLGFGVPTSSPTWGGMLADGREYIVDAWWIALLPGLALMITALSFNLLGDGLRDLLDPTQRDNG